MPRENTPVLAIRLRCRVAQAASPVVVAIARIKNRTQISPPEEKTTKGPVQTISELGVGTGAIGPGS